MKLVRISLLNTCSLLDESCRSNFITYSDTKYQSTKHSIYLFHMKLRQETANENECLVFILFFHEMMYVLGYNTK